MLLNFQLEIASGEEAARRMVTEQFGAHAREGLLHVSSLPEIDWTMAYGRADEMALCRLLQGLLDVLQTQIQVPKDFSSAHPFCGLLHRVTVLLEAGQDAAPLVEKAHWVAKRVGLAVDLPIILSGHAARTTIRQSASIIMANGYKDMEERLKSMPPEYGLPHMHPQLGAMLFSVASVRWEALVDLDRQNLNVCDKVARQVRGRDGGAPGVEAITRRMAGSEYGRILLWSDHPAPETERSVEKQLQHIAERENINPAPIKMVGLRPQEFLALTSLPVAT